jgi:hypothetical protein
VNSLIKIPTKYAKQVYQYNKIARSEFCLAYGVLQATYPNDNSNIFYSTAQVKLQEQQLNKLARASNQLLEM